MPVRDADKGGGSGRHSGRAPRPRWSDLPAFLVRPARVQVILMLVGGLLLGASIWGEVSIERARRALNTEGRCSTATVTRADYHPLEKRTPKYEVMVDGRRESVWNYGARLFGVGDEVGLCVDPADPGSFMSRDGELRSAKWHHRSAFWAGLPLGLIVIVVSVSLSIVRWRNDAEEAGHRRRRAPR